MTYNPTVYGFSQNSMSFELYFWFLLRFLTNNISGCFSLPQLPMACSLRIYQYTSIFLLKHFVMIIYFKKNYHHYYVNMEKKVMHCIISLQPQRSKFFGNILRPFWCFLKLRCIPQKNHICI